MATTPNAGIVYPVVGNILTPLATHFANLANSVDTMYVGLRDGAIGGIGTDAQRIALTGAFKREGYQWYSTDTDYEWFWTGTAWLMKPGQLLVAHTSTPANVTAVGGVIGAVITTPTLNTGQRFRIIWKPHGVFSTSASAGIVVTEMRYRKDGTAVTSSTGTVQPTRSYSSGQSIVVTSPGSYVDDTMASTTTVSAAMYLNSATSGVFGADGFGISIVTM